MSWGRCLEANRLGVPENNWLTVLRKQVMRSELAM